jgi:hypothetical protein
MLTNISASAAQSLSWMPLPENTYYVLQFTVLMQLLRMKKYVKYTLQFFINEVL